MDKISNTLNNSDLNEKLDIELLNYYNIKSYGPKLDHVVLDISIKPRS
jgi:tRNA G37 N-methylase Trm5